MHPLTPVTGRRPKTLNDSGRPRDQYQTGGVDPLPTFVASRTDDRIDQRSVIRAGLLVMLTTGSHQLVGSSHGLDEGIGPLILIVSGRGQWAVAAPA